MPAPRPSPSRSRSMTRRRGGVGSLDRQRRRPGPGRRGGFRRRCLPLGPRRLRAGRDIRDDHHRGGRGRATGDERKLRRHPDRSVRAADRARRGERVGLILNDDLPSLSLVPLFADRAEGADGVTPFHLCRAPRCAGAGRRSPSTGASQAPAPTPRTRPISGGSFPSGAVHFAPGETERIITVLVSGDLANEPDEGFTVTLDGSVAGATAPCPRTARSGTTIRWRPSRTAMSSTGRGRLQRRGALDRRRPDLSRTFLLRDINPGERLELSGQLCPDAGRPGRVLRR